MPQHMSSAPRSNLAATRQATGNLPQARSRVPQQTWSWLEERLNHDFSGVRVHTDGEAARRTGASGARALTQGRDVYFAPGHFQPQTRSGVSLLAHELTHVVQQEQGRFAPQASTRPAAARLALEQEAEQVASAVHRAGPPVTVRGREHFGSLQPDLVDELRARVLGGIEAVADWVMGKAEAAGNTILVQLNALRRQLGSRSHLLLSPEVAARFEAIYKETKADLPSWLPLPSLSFAGPSAQHAGPLAIPIAAILLFLAFVIVMLWFAGNLDPKVRKAREKVAEEVIEKIKEAIKRPADPKPAPDPEPTPDPKPAPQKTGPTIGPTPEEPEKPRRIEKVADSNVFMDRVEQGAAQRLRIDVGYLANNALTLFVPATARLEATRVDPAKTQAARLAGLPGGARIVNDPDGNVEPLRPNFNRILAGSFDEADLRIALRARERNLPLVTTNSKMTQQLVNPSYPLRVAAVGAVKVEVP
jgi:hypothetical protein